MKRSPAPAASRIDAADSHPRGTRTSRAMSTVLTHALIPIILLVIGAVASGDRYFLFLATSAALGYVLTASYNLIIGYAGIFSLAHVAVYGIGAYLAVYAELNWGFSFWASLPLVFIVGGIVGLFLAWPTAHLRGIFIAVATLGFAVATSEIINTWQDVTGGAGGIVGIKIPEFFGVPLVGGTIGYFWVCAAICWIMAEVSLRVDRSGLGRRLIALRENPRTLAAVGVTPTNVRMLVFVIGSAFAAVAGSLFAHFQLTIAPESFGMSRLIGLLLATLIGGAGKFWGPVIGVLALVFIDELGYALGEYQPLLYGIAILILLSMNGAGVAGLLAAGLRRLSPKRVPPVQQDLPHQESQSEAELGDVVLSVEDVVVRFGGVTAVNKGSLEVRRGEVVGLIGPNGAGKTTFFNAITGDVRVSDGTIRTSREELTGHRPYDVVRAGVARTFQSPSLVKEMSVLENVMLGGEANIRATVVGQMLHSPASVADDQDQRERAMAYLQRLGIAEHAYEPAKSLPYGVLRLAEIARNLMLNPDVLLLDEPGAGLTEDEREHLARMLRALSVDGMAVVLVDHNMPLIRAACERLVVVDHGVVLAEGTVDDVLSHPDVITAYLGEAIS